jgi:aldose 1-epimerase
MAHTHGWLAAVLLAGVWVPASAQPYSARQSGDVVELEDTMHQTVVSIVPSVGNQAIEMKVKGHNIFRWTYGSVADFKAKPGMAGVPLLAPWADILDEQAFYANGRRHTFDMELGNVRGARPGHGFLITASQWQVTDLRGDARSAWVTSTLDVFREPATTIENMSAEPMPVSIGFHPYVKLTDSARDEWTIAVPARTHWLLAQTKVPTGETEPIERLFPTPQAAALKDYNLDDVFSDLVRDEQGRAHARITGKAQQLEILIGPNAFSPNPPAARPPSPPKPSADPDFICFEPLAAIVNGLNLAHKGLYKELQHIEPGGTWKESFWIRPSGF